MPGCPVGPRRVPRRRGRPRAASGPGELHFQRFSRLDRMLHLFMIVSFIALALTGMTLKFSYTAWASIVSRLLGGYETAGYIHRVGAVTMMGIFAVHLSDLVRRRNREYGSWRALLFGPNTMLPNRKDLRRLHRDP